MEARKEKVLLQITSDVIDWVMVDDPSNVSCIKISGLKPDCKYIIYNRYGPIKSIVSQGGKFEVESTYGDFAIAGKCLCDYADCLAKITIYYYYKLIT